VVDCNVIPLLQKAVRVKVNNAAVLRQPRAPRATRAWMIHVTTVIPKGMALIVAAFASAIVVARFLMAVEVTSKCVAVSLISHAFRAQLVSMIPMMTVIPLMVELIVLVIVNALSTALSWTVSRLPTVNGSMQLGMRMAVKVPVEH